MELNYSHGQIANLGLWEKKGKRKRCRRRGRKSERRVGKGVRWAKEGTGRRAPWGRGGEGFLKCSGLQGETGFGWFRNYSEIFYLQVRWSSCCLEQRKPW